MYVPPTGRPVVMKLLLFLVLFLLTKAEARMVTFKATRTLKRLIKADFQKFRAWYEQQDTPLRLLSLNPGIDRVVYIRDNDNNEINNNNNNNNINNINGSINGSIPGTGKSKMRGFLAPQTYPGGVTIRSIVDFDVQFDKKTLSVSCKDGALQHEFSGPFLMKPILNILKGLMPTVQTSNVLTLDEQQPESVPILTNSASLEVKFSLPSLFPFPLDAIEAGGSNAMQRTIDSDLTIFLENAALEFEKANV